MWIQRMPAASRISGSAAASGMTGSAGPVGRRLRGRGSAMFGTGPSYGTGPARRPGPEGVQSARSAPGADRQRGVMTGSSLDRPSPPASPTLRAAAGSLADRVWRNRRDLVGLAFAIVVWWAIVVFAEPWGRLWGTGQDAYCYYFPSLADPYERSDWTDPIAYVYSPAFLQVLAPLKV